MHRGNKTNFYVSRKKPIEIVQPLLPSTLLLSPPFHPAHTDTSPLLPRVYLTSRYKIHFIATGTTNRYFSFLGTGSQSDKRMTRRLQPAARCNKWIQMWRRCGYEQGWSVLHVYACVIRQVSVPRCLPTCIGAGHGVLTRSIGFTLS